MRRKGSWSWKYIDKNNRLIFCKKLREFSQFTLHQFRFSGAKPRKWNKKLPSPPEDLSEDIKTQLADYFDVDSKIRVFGYLMDEKFFIIWISQGHKHSK